MIIALAHIPPAPSRARQAAHPRRALDVAVPWLSYAALAGMAAVLIGMALTPGEMAQQLFWSVVSLAVAVGASCRGRTAQGAHRGAHCTAARGDGHERGGVSHAAAVRAHFRRVGGRWCSAWRCGAQQVVQGGAPARGTLNAYVRIEPDGRITW